MMNLMNRVERCNAVFFLALFCFSIVAQSTVATEKPKKQVFHHPVQAVLVFSDENHDLVSSDLTPKEMEYFYYAWKTASDIVHAGSGVGVAYPRVQESQTMKVENSSDHNHRGLSWYYYMTSAYWASIISSYYCMFCPDDLEESLECYVYGTDCPDRDYHPRALKEEGLSIDDGSHLASLMKHRDEFETFFCDMLKDGPTEKLSQKLSKCHIVYL